MEYRWMTDCPSGSEPVSYTHLVLDVHDQFHSRMIDKVLDELDIGKDEALVKSLSNVLSFFKEQY